MPPAGRAAADSGSSATAIPVRRPAQPDHVGAGPDQGARPRSARPARAAAAPRCTRAAGRAARSGDHDVTRTSTPSAISPSPVASSTRPAAVPCGAAAGGGSGGRRAPQLLERGGALRPGVPARAPVARLAAPSRPSVAVGSRAVAAAARACGRRPRATPSEAPIPCSGKGGRHDGQPGRHRLEDLVPHPAPRGDRGDQHGRRGAARRPRRRPVRSPRRRACAAPGPGRGRRASARAAGTRDRTSGSTSRTSRSAASTLASAS